MSRNGYGTACKVPTVAVDIGPGARAQVHRDTREAYQALAVVLAYHRYAVRAKDTGGYNCRPQTGSSVPSAHAVGCAVDVNWLTNPYSPKSVNRLITDMPKAMVDDILRIRTRGGRRVFEWGGNWASIKDAMHFEIDVDREHILKGIDWGTVRQRPFSPGDRTTWITIEQGDRGPTVKALQGLLNAYRITAQGKELAEDGDFGPMTATAVRNFQRSRNLEVDAVVGLATWTALTAAIPPIEGEVGPTKKPPTTVPEHDYQVVVYWKHPADEGAARVVGVAHSFRVEHVDSGVTCLVPIQVGFDDGTGATIVQGANRNGTAARALVVAKDPLWGRDLRLRGRALAGLS